MIKEKIKKIGINMVELSNELDISRPTLYSYINQYEDTKHITSSKYQYIFENLFNQEYTTRIEFLNKLDYYKKLYNNEVLEKEKKYINKKEKVELIDNIIKRMKTDVYSDNYDETIYLFINMLLKDYKKQENFKQIARYFIMLNSNYFEENQVLHDKLFISNFYEMMYKHINKKLVFKDDYFEMFKTRQKEINKQNITNEKNLKATIIKEINKQLEKNILLGLDIEIEAIIENIKLK